MTEIIYDYFTSRILFGYYQQGDRLPSISYICQQFQVSPLTARAALLRIREEGYIETIERRCSTVTFQPDELQEREYRKSFLSRKEGMSDICRSSAVLFGPIARCYFQEQSEASLKRIRSQLKKMKGHPAKQITTFYSEAMRPLNNPLVLNLFWEVVRYLRTPYLQRPANYEDTGEQAAEHIERMLALAEAGDAEKAVEEMQTFSRNVTQLFFESLSVSFDVAEQVKAIPFEWRIYWEHPQLCYTLAAEMMRRIDARLYGQNELLPSCQSLAQEYGVSLITMRRTLELLGDIRITETQNGVGTRVLSGKRAGVPNFSHIQIRRSLILFLQALQICALTCENVVTDTLSSLDSEGFLALDRKLQRLIQEQTTSLLGGTCLQFIGENNPSAFIREVYRQLYQLLLWGHSLQNYYQMQKNRNIFEASAAELQELVRYRNIRGFAGALSDLMATSVKISKDLLLELGFTKDQLI